MTVTEPEPSPSSAPTQESGDESAEDRVVYLDTEAASELADLVDDVPGDADEDLLDRARARLRDAADEVPSDVQSDIAKGRSVAVQLSPDEVDAVETLIDENRDDDRGLLRNVGRGLRSKLKAARKKAKRRR